MPLVFAVLIIVVVFLNAKDSNKNRTRQSAIYAKEGRKTNAVLEQKIMDTYMKHGFSADEAFRKSYEDIMAAGYEPCIPREAYGENSSYCAGRNGFAPEEYDSWLVRDRREDIIDEWKCEHPKELMLDNNAIEARVYQNFPRNEVEYIADIKRRGKRKRAEPIGTFIIHPRLGTCEILAHNWIGNSGEGTYTLKVLKTGKVVTYVRIGDTTITKQGQ